MASRESFRGGDQPSGKDLRMASRCFETSVGVGLREWFLINIELDRAPFTASLSSERSTGVSSSSRMDFGLGIPSNCHFCRAIW